jgi:D-beta-D-heptose 7-phosphate kinase/D-beta-D-heptose 1-phosphate adenosyltransferase
VNAVSAAVTVVGDIMLDVFEDGEVTRISPEAPVIILKNPRTTMALGGAGNTAANVRSLGWDAKLIGAVGADLEGERCAELASALGSTGKLVTVDDYSTTVKRRFLSGGQQIMRLDVEDPLVPPAGIEQLIAMVLEASYDVGAYVISDYDKGVVTSEVAIAIVERGQSAGVPVIVDTKRLDLGCIRGCSIVAPNHHEAERMTGQSDPRLAAEMIAKTTEGAVLVTLGAAGMLLLDGGVETRIASEAREVADVTGAGDTVTAALAVALAEGATPLDAARWANAAAAQAVAHHGTYAVRRDDVVTPSR